MHMCVGLCVSLCAGVYTHMHVYVEPSQRTTLVVILQVTYTLLLLLLLFKTVFYWLETCEYVGLVVYEAVAAMPVLRLLV